jgi:hypothetical protein
VGGQRCALHHVALERKKKRKKRRGGGTRAVSSLFALMRPLPFSFIPCVCAVAPPPKKEKQHTNANTRITEETKQTKKKMVYNTACTHPAWCGACSDACVEEGGGGSLATRCDDIGCGERERRWATR